MKSLPPAFVSAMTVVGWLAAAAPATAAPSAATRIDALLRSVMAEDRLPSLSVAVARDGETVYAGAFGLADVENAVPASTATVYPFGSVTKSVTAVAVMQLAEQRRIDLDAPVHRACTAFPSWEHPPTARLLLGHLGGIRGYDFSRDGDFVNRVSYPSIEAATAKFRDDPPTAEPGTKYVYSSFGYVLLGCVLESASGTEYGEHLRARVLEPAGMRQATLDRPEAIVPHRARGYSMTPDRAWVNATWVDPSDRHPAAGLLATPTDLVRFGTALLAGDLLPEPEREEMWTQQTTAADEPTGYGLGWTVSADGAEVFHGGTAMGATSYLYLRPHDRVVVAFVANLSLWTQRRQELARELARIAGETVATPP